MAVKNNGIWTDRLAVQKAFDKDPQHAYNVVNQVITRQQASLIEANLVPEPSNEEKVSKLQSAKAVLERLGMNTKDIEDKIVELGG